MRIAEKFRRWAAIFLLISSAAALCAQSGRGGSSGGSGSNGGSASGGGAGQGNAAGTGGANSSSMDSGSSSEQALSPADSFKRWYAQRRQGAAGEATAEEIYGIFLPLLGEGFPQAIIRRRIEEASSKKVPPAQAVEAFKRDAEDFSFLLAQARNSKWPSASSKESFYSAVSAALRNGLDRSAVETVFSLARISKLDPKRSSAALTAVSTFRIEHSVGKEDASALAGALAVSRIPANKMSTVLKLASKAKAAGLDSGQILARIMDALRNGGTLSDIEKALAVKI